MGNYISCTLSRGGNSKGIKVIFPSGKIEEFEQGVKAAEMMLEMPSFFVVNTRSLQIGTRFTALNADQDLESGNVYVMLPMKRLNSLVTTSDITAKRVSANKVVRVVPEIQLDFSSPHPHFMHRLSMSGSKKPLLDTISEEPL